MEASIYRKWIKAGVISGFLTMIVYPVLILVSLPLQATLVLACAFGFLLMVASIGLYRFITLNGRTVSLQLGVLFNIIACSVVTMMFTIQIALFDLRQKANIEITKEMKNYIWQIPNVIQLGLDVVWDVFFSAGTILIAVNMFKHPRFGKIFGGSGVVIALALLILNIYTFPIPPGESGLIDLGPLMALWYLAVTIQMTRSFKWVDGAIAELPVH